MMQSLRRHPRRHHPPRQHHRRIITMMTRHTKLHATRGKRFIRFIQMPSPR